MVLEYKNIYGAFGTRKVKTLYFVLKGKSNIFVTLHKKVKMHNNRYNKLFFCLTFFISYAVCGMAQRVEPIKFGDMDQWVIRNIKESRIIGGNTKTLYEIGPRQTINGDEPYSNKGGSPWGTSNVLAQVSGITKTNTSVYSEQRNGNGFCARLETHIEKVKVLGIINISVIAAGSIFLGDMKEPITGTKDGPKAQNFGIPFTGRPSALRYDYSVAVSGEPNRIKLTGFSGRKTVEGKDNAITILFLQKRRENAAGEITAERVGTMVVRYDKNTNGWVNDATYEIHYGDITHETYYDAETMGLRACDYARNSKGESVLVKEIGWAQKDAVPTHLCLQFASSHGGAYIGSPGNKFWIDNVKLVY